MKTKLRLFEEEWVEIISKTVPVNQVPKEKNVLHVLKKRK